MYCISKKNISATPWNLLTVDRKSPITKARQNMITKEFRVLEDGDSLSKHEIRENFGSEYYLNHVMWSSGVHFIDILCAAFLLENVTHCIFCTHGLCLCILAK